MKHQIWVLSTCTEELRPALPRVFGDEASAEAEYDKIMREEWALHSPEAPDETPIPYPGAREANRQLANGFASGDWCDWELTSHTIDIPLPANIQKLIADLSGSAVARLEDCESGVQEGIYDEDECAPVIAGLKKAIADASALGAPGSGAPDPEPEGTDDASRSVDLALLSIDNIETPGYQAPILGRDTHSRTAE